MTEQNAYAILHLHKGSTDDDVKRAWIELVKKYPPEGDTQGRFMGLQKAYEILRDPQKRAREDVFTMNYPTGQFIFSEEAKVAAELPQVEAAAQEAFAAYQANPTNDDCKYEVNVTQCRLAYKYVNIKQFRQAIECWKTILDIDPTNQKAKQNYVFAHCYVGYFYALHNLYDEAIEMLEVALQMLPDNVDLMQNIAIIYDKANLPDKAADYWSEIGRRWRMKLEADPDNQLLKESLSELHMFHGARLHSKVQTADTKGQAVEQYRMVLELNPNNIDAQFKIANTLMEERRFEEAISELKALAFKDPKNMDVLNLLGWAYLNSGKVEIAFSTWRRALQVEPTNQNLRQTINRAHLQIGKRFKAGNLYTQALVHLKEVQKLNPNDTTIILEVGDCMMRKGDKRSAKAAFERVLELDPKNKEARQLMNELRLRG